MSSKFSEDVIPLTDLKVNPGRVVRHATTAHSMNSNFRSIARSRS